MAKPKLRDQYSEPVPAEADLNTGLNQADAQMQEAVLVTFENSARFTRDNSQVPSPVQSIQERLEMEFASQIQGDDESIRDLRPLGFAIAVVFSLIAWTLIIQVVRIGI